jgi:hypothetical protein
MDHTLAEYFRCPDGVADCEIGGTLSANPGFFKFGPNVTCYGRFSSGRAPEDTENLLDASGSFHVNGKQIRLPFDLSQVVGNLRHERYNRQPQSTFSRTPAENARRKLYYFLRPLLPVPVRRRFQKSYLRGWNKINFPHWPVDFSVDALMQRAMALVLESRRNEKVPFIWFWPNGAPSCAIMTHDVETLAGLNFRKELMDCDDLLGIKSSFQIIPEERYNTSEEVLDSIRRRGFEVNVHDLNHDGALFQQKKEFLKRASQINEYARKFRSRGFRSGAMYRNQSWYDALEFSYDMSVPNVAHLDPQRGGCCTVMPYFIGKIVELPLTTIQDYSLFHILNDYSTDLWIEQMELILEKNGLMSFIAHPDYLIEKRAQEVYLDLLTHLAKLRVDRNLWIALPREVDHWWRSRHEMKLVQHGDRWLVEGPDSDRARVAYATLADDRLVYTLEERPEVGIGDTMSVEGVRGCKRE